MDCLLTVLSVIAKMVMSVSTRECGTFAAVEAAAEMDFTQSASPSLVAATLLTFHNSFYRQMCAVLLPALSLLLLCKEYMLV